MFWPIMVAFTVDKTLNWVPRVGIFSHTWRDQVEEGELTYQIIVANAADAVSVNFSGRCKFLQI